MVSGVKFLFHKIMHSNCPVLVRTLTEIGAGGQEAGVQGVLQHPHFFRLTIYWQHPQFSELRMAAFYCSGLSLELELTITCNQVMGKSVSPFQAQVLCPLKLGS